jgi:hypothetical protein
VIKKNEEIEEAKKSNEKYKIALLTHDETI